MDSDNSIYDLVIKRAMLSAENKALVFDEMLSDSNISLRTATLRAFDRELDAVPEGNKIKVIKLVRDWAACSLTDAKHFVDNATEAQTIYRVNKNYLKNRMML